MPEQDPEQGPRRGGVPFADQVHRTQAQWRELEQRYQTWMDSGKAPWPNLDQFAAAHNVSPATMRKRAAKWSAARQARIQVLAQAQEQALTAETAPAQAHPPIPDTGAVKAERLSAVQSSSPPPFGNWDGGLQKTQRRLRDGADLGADALLNEAEHGKGASRIAAAKELLDRAGLLKASENKAEDTPYQGMGADELAERVHYLFPRVIETPPLL